MKKFFLGMLLAISFPLLLIAASESASMDVPAEVVSPDSGSSTNQPEDIETTEDFESECNKAQNNSADNSENDQQEIDGVNEAENSLVSS